MTCKVNLGHPLLMTDTPRLKTVIWVKAYLRICQAAGAFAAVVHKGDPDAGAVAVKVFCGGGDGRLFVQSRDLDGNAVWREPLSVDGAMSAEADIDTKLTRERRIDPDLWVIEIEDREGRSFLP